MTLSLDKSSSLSLSDKYQVMDAIEFMKQFKTGTVQGVITSPPYNKQFRKRGGRSSNWTNSKLMAENYAQYDDDMAPDEYVAWQRLFLTEALRLVGDDGVILYNIGRNIRNLSEDRRQSIVDGFPIRQTIIWNRKSTNNQGGKRPSMFPPIYEMIYVIAGQNWRLPQKYLREMRRWGDVWSIPFETRNPHPAPFPVALAERMVKTADGTVMDPFAGSGTVGVVAHKLGYDYHLCDTSTEYRDLFLKRMEDAQQCILL